MKLVVSRNLFPGAAGSFSKTLPGQHQIVYNSDILEHFTERQRDIFLMSWWRATRSVEVIRLRIVRLSETQH